MGETLLENGAERLKARPYRARTLSCWYRCFRCLEALAATATLLGGGTLSSTLSLGGSITKML